MTRLRHPNVLSLLGSSTAAGQPMAMVLEYMAGASLLAWATARQGTMVHHDILFIAYQVCWYHRTCPARLFPRPATILGTYRP